MYTKPIASNLLNKILEIFPLKSRVRQGFSIFLVVPVNEVTGGKSNNVREKTTFKHQLII